MRPSTLFWLTAALALAAYGATPNGVEFSDAVLLRDRLETGVPHYHAAYVPLGSPFLHAGRALFGWSADAGAIWFSRVCSALAAGGAAVAIARRVSSPLLSGAGALALALAPAIWFFAVCAEVHGLQLLGAVVAYECADRARRASRGRALAWFGAGVLAALATHLTSLLLAPLLAWLALGDDGDHGLQRRSLARLAAGLALAGLAGPLLASTLLAEWQPAQGLRTFVVLWWDRVAQGDFFSGRESLEYLWDEWFVRAGLLWPGTVAGLFVARARRAAVAVLVGCLPFVLIFSQGGVREAGAYFVGLYPPMALATAGVLDHLTRRRSTRLRAALALALVAGQAGLALPTVRSLVRGQDMASWLAAVEGECSPGSTVVTSSLPQMHSAGTSSIDFDTMDLRYALEIEPARDREAVVAERLGILGGRLARGAHVYFDAALIVGDDPRGVFVTLRRRLAESPIALEPRPAEGPPVLFEAVLDAR
ncbi:MAG: hypothetical protein AAFZ65_09730 [Planctomycetota bacterium]